MALVVEDGTGKTDAESYASIAQANAYHLSLGNAAWEDLDDEVKEQLLRKASAYMARYAERWLGVRRTSEQALDWPRGYVPRADCALTGELYWPEDEVPATIANACAALALRADTDDLSPDPGRQTIEETVGPITTRYAVGASMAPTYADVEIMLARFLKAGTSGAVRRTVRV